jgi:hypothetical protein
VDVRKTQFFVTCATFYARLKVDVNSFLWLKSKFPGTVTAKNFFSCHLSCHALFSELSQLSLYRLSNGSAFVMIDIIFRKP